MLLPHLVKLCEISENQEQFRWIKDTTLKLREIVQIENAVCHQVNNIGFSSYSVWLSLF